jgi:hypothetical protein
VELFCSSSMGAQDLEHQRPYGPEYERCLGRCGKQRKKVGEEMDKKMNSKDLEQIWPMDTDWFGYMIVEIPRDMHGKEIEFITEYVADNLGEIGKPSPRKVIDVSEPDSERQEEYKIVDLVGQFAEELRVICEERGIQAGQPLDRGILRAISKRARWYLMTHTPYWYNVTIVPEGEAEVSLVEEYWERMLARGELSLN